ncbi:ABC transporter permease [Geodermatophilus sp. SYSU D00698]
MSTRLSEAPARPVPPVTGTRPSTTTGTGTLLRFALRRDRVRLPVWIAAGTFLVALQSVSSQSLYDTAEALAAYRASVGSNAATIALAGPPVGLGTVAGAVAFEISATVMLVAALMATSTVTRHTRADEEAGRTELVRSARVGRHAPLLAAVLLSSLACAVLTVAVWTAATATGLPAVGSLFLGASFGACGLVFTGITAVAVQVTGHTRAVHGLVGGLFAVSFVLRALGDVEGSRVVWTSPIGWAQATHPFSDDAVAPLVLCAVVAVALVLAGFALLDRRDLGAGFVQPRPGPAHAPWSLRSPLGLAVRLQRGAFVAWTLGLALLGVVQGALAESVETLVAGNEQALAVFGDPDVGELVDAYLGTTFGVTALLAGAYAVSSVLRARGEESGQRAEPVLATATSRSRWLGSHVAVALAGSGLALTASGLTTGVVRVAQTGEAAALGRMVGAAVAYVPAVWVLAGTAVALFGLLPRAATALAWTAVGVSLVLTLFAGSFGWPGWVGGLSPFGWVPLMPLEPWTATPVLVLTGVAAVLLVAGSTGFARRDLATG